MSPTRTSLYCSSSYLIKELEKGKKDVKVPTFDENVKEMEEEQLMQFQFNSQEGSNTGEEERKIEDEDTPRKLKKFIAEIKIGDKVVQENAYVLSS